MDKKASQQRFQPLQQLPTRHAQAMKGDTTELLRHWIHCNPLPSGDKPHEWHINTKARPSCITPTSRINHSNKQSLLSTHRPTIQRLDLQRSTQHSPTRNHITCFIWTTQYRIQNATPAIISCCQAQVTAAHNSIQNEHS
jgi:hypothetical protein